MAYRFVLPFADVGDGISNPNGARLYFFDQGTSNPKTTYSNFGLTVANTDPVISDADGVFSDIFLDIAADVTLRDGDDALIWGPETVYPPDDSISSLAASSVAVTDSGGNYVGTNAETIFAEIAQDYVRANRADTISGTMTFSGADINLADNQLIRPNIQDYSLDHTLVSSSSGTITLDLITGNSFATTLTENITTVTISNVPASGLLGQFVWRITQDGAGGAYTVTQPSGVTVPGGGGITISTGNNAVDRLIYSTVDGGTTWEVDLSQAYAT